MAAVRALVAPRLAAASAFAPLHALAPRAALHSSAPRPRARVALVLSGCGVYDGTELHEASAVLVHLSRGGAEVQIFAPDVPQMHVIDHTKGQPSESETRNVLTESARIARGKITDLARLSAADHDAAIFPGGFGAAKNLSTFAVDGKDCRVHKDVERVLKEFHEAGKPVGSEPLRLGFHGRLAPALTKVGVCPCQCAGACRVRGFGSAGWRDSLGSSAVRDAVKTAHCGIDGSTPDPL
ncbi:glutamine amidotransferase-like class 1 domain-containing protein 3A, mitochondrial isoform X3 [Panthera leo]|uniref:glutamine amidotransferase-like class 1 domain-containing protein 3A, mitochondrial isoform X3 n=1 Tax=Panthera leo TaxID=9689 RepID=UPI001C6A595D|nr:glutamine amidotransferase-like class 1 domain-containing protein 3A, mitochondrial isoform X3 [Panthera leo]